MRMLRRLFLPVSIVILAAAAVIVPLPMFVERPRAPLNLVDAVRLEEEAATPIAGSYLLTAVNLRRATPVDLVLGWVDDDATFLSVTQVIGPAETDNGFFDNQRELFAATADLAAALGLEAAGYDAVTGDGALVAGIQPGSPADEVLQEGDVIIAVDGEEIATAGDLVAQIRARDAGERRRLLLRRGDETVEVTVTPRPLTGNAPQVGVQVDTEDLEIALPLDVEIDGGRIGGPSGGLMVALTVYDLASPDDLAAGRRIAGTGTILDATGTVGPIGGLSQKVESAARAGAELFLAPASQSPEAAASVPAGSVMEVIGVANLDEAIEALGG